MGHFAVTYRHPHYELHVGADRWTTTERHSVDREAARHGVAVDWEHPRPISDGRTTWPLTTAVPA